MNSPPKPHAFVSLPLQSIWDNPAWQEMINGITIIAKLSMNSSDYGNGYESDLYHQLAMGRHNMMAAKAILVALPADPLVHIHPTGLAPLLDHVDRYSEATLDLLDRFTNEDQDIDLRNVRL